jgi:PAS domain S-box-containing protein
VIQAAAPPASFRFLLICLICIVFCHENAAGQEKSHFLVLHSYNKGLEWTDSEDAGIMSVLQTRLLEVEVHTEYMDSKRVAGTGGFADFLAFLTKKYATTSFSVIICTDDDAFNFVNRNSQTLFRGVPIIFCGVNYIDEALLAAGRHRFTGVVEAFDIPTTLRTALRLHPDTKKIVVINDRTTTGQANRKILDALLSEFTGKVEFEFIEDRTMAELQAAVQALSSGTLLLLMTFNRDSSGEVFDYNRSIAMISRVAGIPIYGVWDFYLGRGIVGGMLTSGRDQGKTAAEIALRVVDGEPVENIPVIARSPNRFMFDFNQLQRFGIAAGKLPEESIIINRPVSFMADHRRVIWSGLAVVCGLIAIIILLLARIAERRRSATEMARAHRRTVTILESITDGFIAFDRNFRFTYVNNEAEKTLGRDRESLLGRNYFEVFPFMVGTEVERLYRQVMARGIGGELQYWHAGQEGGKGKWISLKAYPAEGGGVSAYFKDVTVEMRLERELRQAQKMEAIGTLAGGIAHDFNNILAIIMGFTEIAMLKLPEPGPVRDNLQRVMDAGARATDLVRQILTFSRSSEHEKQPVDFAVFIKEALKLMRPLLPTTIEIQSDIAVSPAPVLVLMDSTEIHQVLMNLCTNAAHAMGEKGGTLSVRVTEFVADAVLASRHLDIEPGGYVCLSVSDTGHGMDAALIERIFDPYFTTKELGAGTGLGLPVVQGIVKGHGGAITVYSEPGTGTTFKVFLPRIAGGAAAEAPAAEIYPPGSERILFVDDERNLAQLGAEMLEPSGYTVSVATDSRVALEAFRADPGAFDLVITDMTMPHLTGRQLAAEIKAIRRDLPVILCTGFSELINERSAREEGIDDFLMKPYGVGDLLRTIHKVLRKG